MGRKGFSNSDENDSEGEVICHQSANCCLRENGKKCAKAVAHFPGDQNSHYYTKRLEGIIRENNLPLQLDTSLLKSGSQSGGNLLVCMHHLELIENFSQDKDKPSFSTRRLLLSSRRQKLQASMSDVVDSGDSSEGMNYPAHVVSCMSMHSLRRYKKHFNFTCANNKKAISEAVTRHFRGQFLVKEQDVLSTFISMAKKSDNSDQLNFTDSHATD